MTPQQQRDQRADHHKQDREQPQFRVVQVDLGRAAPQGQEVKREIHCRDEHEEHDQPLDDGIVEMTDRCIPGREAGRGNGRKTVRDGIEQAHAGGPQRQRTDDGQGDVDRPQCLGGFGDARGEPVFLDRPGDLGLVDFHAADLEHGQDRDCQHDNAQPAHPLQLLAIPANRDRRLLDAGKHRGAGGGDAGGGLEYRIGQADVEYQKQWQGAGQRDRAPARDHDQEAIGHAQFAAVAADRKVQRKTGRGNDQQAGDKCSQCTVIVDAGK